VAATTGNLLLDALSPELRQTVLSLCRPVDLPIRTLLHEQGEPPQYVYFLCSGITSVVVTMAEGGSAEVGLIGREGIVGAMQLLGPTPTPAQSFIQMEGTAQRIRLEDLKAMFITSNELRSRILEFVQQQTSPSSRSPPATNSTKPKSASPAGSSCPAIAPTRTP